MSERKKNSVETVEILFGSFKGTYKIHSVAKLFPPLRGKAYEELKRSIHENGQQEPIVIDGDELLDGSNRLAVLNDLKMEPIIVQFSSLKTGLTPGAWIAAKNLARRHLTNDQRLAITDRYLRWCKENGEKAAPGKNIGLGGHNLAAGQQSATEFPQKPAEIPPRSKRGRPRGQRSVVEELASEANETRYRAEQMVKVRALSPELAAAIEQGRLTLKEAAAQLQKTTAAPKPKLSGNAQTSPAPPTLESTLRQAISRVQDAQNVASTLGQEDRLRFWQLFVQYMARVTNDALQKLTQESAAK
jgi:hypothetical protein